MIGPSSTDHHEEQQPSDSDLMSYNVAYSASNGTRDSMDNVGKDGVLVEDNVAYGTSDGVSVEDNVAYGTRDSMDNVGNDGVCVMDNVSTSYIDDTSC